MVAADSGSAANWYARHLRFHGDIRGSLSGTLATMGPGVPYAIGAKWAHPERPAIALVGDGAMQMNGMAELITVAHYWQQWADPRLVVAVLHNNDLNQVTWEMRAMEGSPEVRRVPDPARRRLRRLRPQSRPGRRQHRRPGGRRDRPGTRRCPRTGPPCSTCAATRTCRRSRRTRRWSRPSRSPRPIVHGDEDAWGFVKQGVKQKVQQYLPGTQGRRRGWRASSRSAERRYATCGPAGSSGRCPR